MKNRLNWQWRDIVFDLVRWGIADEALNAYLYESKITTVKWNQIYEREKRKVFPNPQDRNRLQVLWMESRQCCKLKPEFQMKFANGKYDEPAFSIYVFWY